MADRLRWGILGTGNIARQFAAGVAASARGVVTAVGSRGDASARSFAESFEVPNAHGEYDSVLRRADVDAVYVSLPNTLHHAWTIAASRAGKHVLCEKPLAATAAEAEEMFDAAARAGRVLMEAFMYRCHPLTLALLDAIRGGAIGDVTLIRTSFCFHTKRLDNIRFRPDLAGGAMMDVGCYCLSFSRLIAGGEPTEVHVTARLHPTGVDELAAGTLRFGPGGPAAAFTCGMTVQADNAAEVCGTAGYIKIPVPWKPPVRGAHYVIGRQATPKMDAPGAQPGAATAPVAPPQEVVTVDAGGALYGIEADDFAASVRGERPPRVSRQDTMGNMRLLDQIRAQIGLAY